MKKLSHILALLLVCAACSPFEIYVSPDGDDAASGSKSAPLATAASAVRKASAWSLGHKGRDVEVILEEGEYPVTSTLSIDGSMFSGAFTLRAEDCAKVVFTGETRVTGWQKVSDPKALAKLPCPENVLQADLKAAGITEYGDPLGSRIRLSEYGDKGRPDFYYDGKRQTLARWPDEGLARTGAHLGNDRSYPVVGYVDGRIDKWADEDDPCLHGYWGNDWLDIYNRAVVDKSKKAMYIVGDKSPYGYRGNARFRGINLLCELDAPGEYWLDRSNGHIFWYAPEGFSGEGACFSAFKEDYMLELNGCSGLTVKGIEMCGGRGGAISVKGGKNVAIEDCGFFRFAETVINVKGGTGHKILRCALAELGCAGMALEGGDRRSLVPAGFEVADCTIESLALFYKTYQPCIRFVGCGLTISHNLFRDCPSSALRLDGNDVLVEYCVFEDLVLESDDQGGIDMWGDPTFRGTVIRNNYFHNIGDPEDNIAGGVRFDDRISGCLVEHNIIHHCGSHGFGGCQIHGGMDNVIRENVFFDCTHAVSFATWTAPRWMGHTAKEMKMLGLTPEMDALTPMGKAYVEKYPDIVHIQDSAYVNRNYVLDNLVVKTADVLYDYHAWGLPDVVSDGNALITDDAGMGLDHWISDEVLSGYGIPHLGFEEMGPRK